VFVYVCAARKHAHAGEGRVQQKEAQERAKGRDVPRANALSAPGAVVVQIANAQAAVAAVNCAPLSQHVTGAARGKREERVLRAHNGGRAAAARRSALHVHSRKLGGGSHRRHHGNAAANPLPRRRLQNRRFLRRQLRGRLALQKARVQQRGGAKRGSKRHARAHVRHHHAPMHLWPH